MNELEAGAAIFDAALERDLAHALERRADLVSRLHAEGTTCYRLFHGVAEGLPGLAIDRYGPILVVQTWRAPLGAGDLDRIANTVAAVAGLDLEPAWRHRAPARRQAARASTDASGVRHLRSVAPVGHELGVAFDVRPYHRGRDPLLFLDLRAGRRRLMAGAAGQSVLNLFAYTCSAGVVARVAGAPEVWNVDVAASALAVGRANAELNGVQGEAFQTIGEDAIAVARQLAGLPIKGRGARGRAYRRFAARTFDIVVLDPPRWAAGPFGAVDVVRDYPGLFKPALLATRPGGRILATNHVPSVALADWLAVLKRTADKAGRALGAIEVLTPESDFPSFDAQAPLKIAWVTVAD